MERDETKNIINKYIKNSIEEWSEVAIGVEIWNNKL